LISVLITIYKEPWKWIEEALSSLRRQTYNNLELVLIIDNPENSLIDKIKNYVDENFNNSKVIVNSENKGLVESLNIAYKNSSGIYIARMDSDDICYTNRFKDELRFMEENNLDFVASAIDLIDTNGHMIKEVSLNKNLLRKQVLKVEQYSNQFWHPTWLLKRDVIENLNGYRDIPSTEDYDFVVRALLKNYDLGILNKALVQKRINQNSISELDTYRQTLIAQKISRELKKGKIIDSTDIPIVSSADKNKYIKIKNTFINRHNISRIEFCKLIWKLLATTQGRIFLRSVLLQKISTKF
jgi:glycosyltransferase involved in cell wall biosynthesis